MSVQRARSADEYIEWVRQAVFEVGDLRDCLEFEMDEMGHFPAWLDPLERGIKDVFQAMSEGRYAFGREDLPFMDIAEAHGGRLRAENRPEGGARFSIWLPLEQSSADIQEAL